MSRIPLGKRCRSTSFTAELADQAYCSDFNCGRPTTIQGMDGLGTKLVTNSASISYGDTNSDEELETVPNVGPPPTTLDLYPELFTDNSISVGGLVKARGQVINEYSMSIKRPPNMNCRVESFGRICQKFCDRKRRWVCEMGFGGLLYFAKGMHLPRQLAYWIMTRIDPISRVFIGSDGQVYPFSKNQVGWILGIPSGSKVVPSTKNMSDEVRERVQTILLKYGRTWETKPATELGRSYTSIGIPVTASMMDQLEGPFEEDQEEEFKTLFFIISLQMILCPTQSPRLPHDLLPAIGCAMDCSQYDWCELVLAKLMDNVASFARRFYANGYAGGCGGCAIFAVIFYLDRLKREPMHWDAYPRVKAWDMKQIGIAAKRDRYQAGDFGKLGLLDVAYGERHPREARDTMAPPFSPVYHDVSKQILCTRERRRRDDLRCNWTLSRQKQI